MNYQGNPVSSGIAIGQVYKYIPFTAHVSRRRLEPAEIAETLERFRALKQTAAEELDSIRAMMMREGEDKAKIFSAQLEILDDEELSSGVALAVAEEHLALDWAISQVFDEFIALLSDIDDPLIRGRVMDLQDVKNRLLRCLAGVSEKNLSALPEDVIIVTHDLLPSDTAIIDRQHILGIITEIGGETSHSAIIARSYGLPAISGVPDIVSLLSDGEVVIADALSGTVTTDPFPEDIAKAKAMRQAFLSERELQRAFLPMPCATRDGKSISIGMNIGVIHPEEEAQLAYVDFIGLFRTEFLYMGADHFPSEEEQFEAYKYVLTKANGKPVTLRTLDIGGDKTLPYFQLPKEDNPFLGVRALRLCLSKPDLFRTQLRAALRASVYGDLWVMFPMVGSIRDIQAAFAAVEDAKRSLDEEQISYSSQVKYGIMVEIPSIALLAKEAAACVDFASIGTNDLCQYLSAADRQNAAVRGYYDGCIPAALRLMKQVADAFQAAGKPVSICGEMGGNPIYAPILAGLGFEKLSMSSSQLAAVKHTLSLFTAEELKTISRAVLSMTHTEEIVAYIKSRIQSVKDL